MDYASNNWRAVGGGHVFQPPLAINVHVALLLAPFVDGNK
jgi:hypothetical protein